MLELFSNENIKGVLFSNKIRKESGKTNIDIMDNVKTNQYGMPVFKEIFKLLKKRYDSLFYAYINSDILIDPSFLNYIKLFKRIHKKINNPV